MHTDHLDGLNLAIAKLISESKVPLGQGHLSLLLRKQGFSLSTPTVGRRLQQLEFNGALRKVSVEGRVLTPAGMNMLARWEAEANLRDSNEVLLRTLKRADKKHILDLLAARNALEVECAGLAAKYASTQSRRRMEKLIAHQAAAVKAGHLGIEGDIAFHLEIAKASRNALLHSLVSVLRNHTWYNLVIASVRRIVGTRLVVDHTAILEGIKARDYEKARQAMASHISGLQNDLNRYWPRDMVSVIAAEAAPNGRVSEGLSIP